MAECSNGKSGGIYFKVSGKEFIRNNKFGKGTICVDRYICPYCPVLKYRSIFVRPVVLAFWLSTTS